jgi:hypothetical protein
MSNLDVTVESFWELNHTQVSISWFADTAIRLRGESITSSRLELRFHAVKIFA